MYASLWFWLALGLPGYVVVRRVFPKDVESGLLGTVALSYLAALGLLSPISILCYVFHAPMAIFSGACALAFLAAAVEILRRRWWRDLGKLLVGGLSLGLLIVVVDMVTGALTGANTGGDAPVHLARIRSILDHGFHNFDPFVPGEHFFPIYHTNLLHALYAACSQLTGTHHISVWFVSLAWAKLLVAAGAYYMTWCVFGRKWPCWVATAFVVGCQGPVNFLIYPNKLVPYWLAAMMIGFAVQACRGRCTWRSSVKLALGALVIGQMHSLYGAFVGIAVAPLLVSVGLFRIVRRREDRWRMAVCTLALAAALPFLLISQTTSRSASQPATPAAAKAGAAVKRTPKHTSRFRHFDNGWLMLNPRSGWGIPRGKRDAWLSACLVAGIACALLGRHRKNAALFLAIIGTTAAVLYIPPLCAAALRVFRQEWILSRMAIVLYLGFVVLVPASIASLIEPWTRFGWVRQLLIPVALAAALPYFNHRSPYTWRDHYANLRLPAETREGYLALGRAVMAFCEEHIPPGTTVLTEDWSGVVLVANHDAYIVAPRSGGNGIADLGQRRKDLKAMLAADTPWDRRRNLLRKYGITYFWPARSPLGWLRGHVKETRTQPGFRLFIVDTEE